MASERSKSMSEYKATDSVVKTDCIYCEREPNETAYCHKWHKYLDHGCECKKEVALKDVVEVVRCKDCMWGNNKTRSGKRYCELSDMYEVDDGFCNWGEKIK